MNLIRVSGPHGTTRTAKPFIGFSQGNFSSAQASQIGPALRESRSPSHRTVEHPVHTRSITAECSTNDDRLALPRGAHARALRASGRKSG